VGQVFDLPNFDSVSKRLARSLLRLLLLLLSDANLELFLLGFLESLPVERCAASERYADTSIFLGSTAIRGALCVRPGW